MPPHSQMHQERIRALLPRSHHYEERTAAYIIGNRRGSLTFYSRLIAKDRVECPSTNDLKNEIGAEADRGFRSMSRIGRLGSIEFSRNGSSLADSCALVHVFTFANDVAMQQGDFRNASFLLEAENTTSINRPRTVSFGLAQGSFSPVAPEGGSLIHPLGSNPICTRKLHRSSANLTSESFIYGSNRRFFFWMAWFSAPSHFCLAKCVNSNTSQLL